MVIPHETLLEILRNACRAPSGDNTQPWRFVVRGNTIQVINMPEKDTSLFNYLQRTNHLALGAAIENLRISAESNGFRVEINIFPNAHDRLVVAEVTLTSDSSIRNDLAPYIVKRATNRRKYHSKQVEQEKLSELSVLVNDRGSRIVFITDRALVKDIAHIVSAGEKLALENRVIHDFLFEHVTWTKEEDSKKHGFLIDTFEFSPPQKAAFKLLGNWYILNFLLPFGISRLIARDMESVHATSAAFGTIILPGNTAEDYLEAGILLERLWLTATKLGLALQPTTTVHFIGSRVLEGDPGSLSIAHQQLLRENYTALTKQFGVGDMEHFGFIFRLGYADVPTAATTRFEPDITLQS